MADLPTPVLVIAGLFLLTWSGLIVRIVVATLAQRRLEGADTVRITDAAGREGTVVSVRGHVVVGPSGLVRAHRTGAVGVYARFRVSRSVDRVQELQGDRRVVTDTDVEQEVTLPAGDPVLEVGDGDGARIRVRVADLAELPAERVRSDTVRLPRPTGARSAVRQVTEDVVREGTPVTLRGRVEVDDDGTWLRPSLGEPVAVEH